MRYFTKLFCLIFFLPGLYANLSGYQEHEKEEIERDLQVVRSVCRVKEAVSKERPFYLAAVGDQGSRKSTILERFLVEHPEYQTGVYLDPYQRALKFMVHTYHAQSLSALQAASKVRYLDVHKAAYEKWNDASQYITSTLLNEVVQKKADLIHGTSLPDPAFLKQLKAAGYQIILVLCYSKDDVRRDAIEYQQEQQRLYAGPPISSSFAEKMGSYFQCADTVYLYWSDDLLTEEGFAATLDQGEMKIGVGCYCFLDKFITNYEQDRGALLTSGVTIPTWEELIQIYITNTKVK